MLGLSTNRWHSAANSTRAAMTTPSSASSAQTDGATERFNTNCVAPVIWLCVRYRLYDTSPRYCNGRRFSSRSSYAERVPA